MDRLHFERFVAAAPGWHRSLVLALAVLMVAPADVLALELQVRSVAFKTCGSGVVPGVEGEMCIVQDMKSRHSEVEFKLEIGLSVGGDIALGVGLGAKARTVLTVAFSAPLRRGKSADQIKMELQEYVKTNAGRIAKDIAASPDFRAARQARQGGNEPVPSIGNMERAMKRQASQTEEARFKEFIETNSCS